MADNINGIPFNTPNEGINFPVLTVELVHKQALSLGVLDDYPEFSMNDVYVVWFAYTLGHFKALCSTSLPDGRYYEVTYNPHDDGTGTAFVDTYVKTHNVAITVNFVKSEN
jgi:Family of unknown function (DUF6275)